MNVSQKVEVYQINSRSKYINIINFEINLFYFISVTNIKFYYRIVITIRMLFEIILEL